jgi:glucokinase
MVESLYLVADVGGTNCRLALADVNGVRTDTINRFQNQKYASFSDIVRVFLCDKPKPIQVVETSQLIICIVS